MVMPSIYIELSLRLLIFIKSQYFVFYLQFFFFFQKPDGKILHEKGQSFNSCSNFL